MLDTDVMPTDSIHPRTLKATDRCDRCGGQAFVAVTVTLGSSNLLFCGHHFADVEVKLRSIAVLIVDERFALLERVNG